MGKYKHCKFGRTVGKYCYLKQIGNSFLRIYKDTKISTIDEDEQSTFPINVTVHVEVHKGLRITEGYFILKKCVRNFDENKRISMKAIGFLAKVYEVSTE